MHSSDSSVPASNPRLGQIDPVENYFPKTNHVLLSNFFLFEIRSLLNCSQQTPEKRIRGHRARLREKEDLFCYRGKFEGNILRCVRARAYLRANLRSRDAQCNTSSCKQANESTIQLKLQPRSRNRNHLKENVKKTIWTERSCVYFDETANVESLIDKTAWFENSRMPTQRSWRVPILMT